MKTILFFIDSLGSGGAQRQIVQLAVGFKERDYNVSFLIYNKKSSGFYYDYLMDRGINVDDIDEQNYFKRIVKVRRYIRKFKPQVLVSFLEASCFMAELASFPFKKWKLIVGERSANPAIAKTPKLIFFRQFHFIADYIVANSSANLSIIRKISPLVRNRKYKLIYNLLDCQRICPSNRSFVFKNDGVLKLLVAASHRRLKNLNGLIEAVNMLPDEKKKCIRVDWYGSNVFDTSFMDARQKIDEYNLDKLFHFHDATLDIYKFMEESDVVGLFSFFEGFPNAICEGMLLEKPIIATRVSDIPKILKDGENAFLCNADDFISIRNALISLIDSSPEELRKMGVKNRQMAVSLFNKEKILDEYEALFV